MSVDFDSKAHHWETPQKLEHSAKVVTSIMQYVPLQASWRLVELGAGTGVVGRQLASAVKSVTLVDPSVEMIAVAKQIYEREGIANISAIHGTLEEYSTAHTQSADVVVMVMALHHIHEVEPAIEQLVSTVSEVGYVCIIDLYPNDGSFHHGVEGFDGHNGIDPNEIAKKLTDLGCRIVHNGELSAEMHAHEGAKQFILVAQKSA